MTFCPSKNLPGHASTRRLAPGMSLVELAVVILVLLILVSVLLLGAHGWKQGVDRARCIVNIRQMQMSVRALAAANEYPPGADLGAATPPVNVLAELIGPGHYVPELPTCPGPGIYFFGGDVIPVQGQLYMSCSLASSHGHEPKDFSDW